MANISLCLVLVMARMSMMVVKTATLFGDDSDDEDMNDYGENIDDGDNDNSVWWMIIMVTIHMMVMMTTLFGG